MTSETIQYTNDTASEATENRVDRVIVSRSDRMHINKMIAEHESKLREQGLHSVISGKGFDQGFYTDRSTTPVVMRVDAVTNAGLQVMANKGMGTRISEMRKDLPLGFQLADAARSLAHDYIFSQLQAIVLEDQRQDIEEFDFTDPKLPVVDIPDLFRKSKLPSSWTANGRILLMGYLLEARLADSSFQRDEKGETIPFETSKFLKVVFNENNPEVKASKGKTVEVFGASYQLPSDIEYPFLAFNSQHDQQVYVLDGRTDKVVTLQKVS